jgi:prepilin-type N-terminal cleavage/methylation domain-containing protein
MKRNPSHSQRHSVGPSLRFPSSSFGKLPENQCPKPASKGFTLVELLVVVLIIAVLAGVALSVTRSARRSAIKVADMTNLRSLSTAAMAAGSDNAGRLPHVHAASNAAPYYLKDRETLESFGIFKENCYIPNKSAEGGAPNYAFWYMFGNQTPVHYSYFAKDAPTGNSWFQNGSVSKPSKEEYRGTIPYEDIIKDPTKAFARSVTDDAWYPILWSGICRDYAGKKQLAAVVENGEALGVNVMYLDSHAEWVDKKKMKVRYTAAGGLKIHW